MKNYLLPIFMAFFANFLLGASALYWQIFADISPITLVVYRVIFSFVLLMGFIICFAKIKHIIARVNFKLLALHSVAALFVAINWGAFIWASIHGSVLESGLGYLIAPVITMLIGMLIFRETISRENLGAITCIALALMILMLSQSDLTHWVYWTIGLTWGGYTILKKATTLTAIDGLLFETFALLIIIFAAQLTIDVKHIEISLNVLNANPLLYLCGIVSLTPLIMFAFAARKLNAYNMGAIQFVLPTTQLIISIIFYKQLQPPLTYICFSIIWMSLVITTLTKKWLGR